MPDEFAARQRAITLRLSGRPVQDICQALGRSEAWFHKWWRRYLEAGAWSPSAAPAPQTRKQQRARE
jgi:transposase-like protein